MQFQFEQKIELPRASLFVFHEDPQHLVLLHRGWSAFRLIHHDGNLQKRSRVWFETTIAGILPVVLGFEHHIYEPPYRFGEQLIHGPFRKFTHIHEFDASGEANSTVVRDLLEVELPWYYGGELAVGMFIVPWLRRVFRFRAAALEKLVHSSAISDAAEKECA